MSLERLVAWAATSGTDWYRKPLIQLRRSFALAFSAA
jgi:hypothetical protein